MEAGKLDPGRFDPEIVLNLDPMHCNYIPKGPMISPIEKILKPEHSDLPDVSEEWV